MELRQLKAFVKVAETLNFSEAAKNLFVSQSALSQSLKKLEDEVGTPLFHRDNRSVVLTEAGETLLPQAIKTIEASETCISRLNDLAGMKRGTLNIGITHSYRIISSNTLNQFIKQYPGINFNIYYKTSQELIDMLIDKKVDVVLSYKSKETPSVVESHNIFEDHLCAIVSRHHPLASKSKVTLQEISRYPLALPAEGMQARCVLDRVLERAHFTLLPRIEMNEVTPLLSLVAYGDIVTILSGQSCRTKEETIAVPLDVEGGEMSGCFHILKDSYLKKSAREFIQILCQTHLLDLKMQSLFK